MWTVACRATLHNFAFTLPVCCTSRSSSAKIRYTQRVAASSRGRCEQEGGLIGNVDVDHRVVVARGVRRPQNVPVSLDLNVVPGRNAKQVRSRARSSMEVGAEGLLFSRFHEVAGSQRRKERKDHLGICHGNTRNLEQVFQRRFADARERPQGLEQRFAFHRTDPRQLL